MSKSTVRGCPGLARKSRGNRRSCATPAGTHGVSRRSADVIAGLFPFVREIFRRNRSYRLRCLRSRKYTPRGRLNCSPPLYPPPTPKVSCQLAARSRNGKSGCWNVSRNCRCARSSAAVHERGCRRPRISCRTAKGLVVEPGNPHAEPRAHHQRMRLLNL